MFCRFELAKLGNSIKCLKGQLEAIKNENETNKGSVPIILETVKMLEEEYKTLKDKMIFETLIPIVDTEITLMELFQRLKDIAVNRVLIMSEEIEMGYTDYKIDDTSLTVLYDLIDSKNDLVRIKKIKPQD